MFEYRFTNCSYREHGAGNISNPSKPDDIIHYFHIFLTFDGDNINTRDLLFHVDQLRVVFRFIQHCKLE